MANEHKEEKVKAAKYEEKYVYVKVNEHKTLK